MERFFFTTNTHMKYQSSSTHYSIVINKVIVFKNQYNLQGQSQGHNYRFCHMEYPSEISKLANTRCSKVISNVEYFDKRSNSNLKVTGVGQNFWYTLKGLASRNIHKKYQSSSTHCLKVISKVNVFKKQLILQAFTFQQ